MPKARKVYDLDENGERIRLPSGNWKCHKENTVDWNDQKYAEVWRHSWETITNRYLEAAGRPERVDLRSFERQGIQQIPTVHLGPAAHQMEKRGVETFLGNLNRDIRAANSLMQSIRRQLKQNENRMRTIAQIRDAAAVHAKLKPIHDTFIKKNFKLTKDAYAAQHKEELDTFNKAVRTLMKLNGSTTVDFSALDAEFSALQSGSAELRTKLETLQPDVSALKNIRKYIDMVLNKQQLSAPGGKTPEKESVLKKLNDSKAALEQKKSQTQPKESEHTL